MENLYLESSASLDPTVQSILSEVRRGLTTTPRSLPPWLFYDAAGSALFEEITELPEYYLSRVERQIFNENGGAIIKTALDNTRAPLRIVELAAGSAAKTTVLLDAAARQATEVCYVPLDISSTALDNAREHLGRLLPGIRVTPTVCDYVSSPAPIGAFRGVTLALYIGSSIGNFEPEVATKILANLRAELGKKDALLLGVDLVKSEDVLIPAYDDAQGVTAEFNRNVLRRLNRELGADFDLNSFAHRIVWNAERSRIEMHLASTEVQRVTIPMADMEVSFDRGETIHTENSYKYTQRSIDCLLLSAGFRTGQNWTDEKGWYSVTLAHPI